MEPRNERLPGGPVVAGAVALLIVGLLTLVTLGASGGRPTRHGHLAARPVPAGLQDSWITLLIIAYGFAIVGVLVMMFRRRHRWQDPDSHWLRNYCAVLVFMTLITGIGSWAITHGHLRVRSQKLFGQQAQRHPGGLTSPAARPVPARPAHFQWPLALAVGGFVLLGGAWIFIRRNRPGTGITAPGGVEEELARAIGSTIDDLRGERDARRAVIAAYANMERILASHGLARGRSEVPYEYLARVLQLFQVRESAVRSLTELFEYAKFSEHQIDPTMKERAIDSLITVKEDLQVTQELAA
ncbi:MAG TPA: DUF4129 domain-containing protein [Gaiellaceae bacterium]